MPSCIVLWPIKNPKNINKACYSLIPLFFCWFRIRVNPSSRIRSVVDRHYKYIKKYNNTIHRVHSHKCYHIAYCESHKKLCKYLQITFNPPPWSHSMLFLSHRLRWHAHSWKKNWLILKNEASKKKLENTLHPQLYGLTRTNLTFQLLRILPSVGVCQLKSYLYGLDAIMVIYTQLTTYSCALINDN